MQTIFTESELRDAILQLENQRTDDERILREQFHLAYNSMKPINLIKSTFRDAIGSPDLKDNLLNTSVGLTAGYLSKILFQSVTGGPFKKILGSALMFGVTKLVAKNPEAVKSLGNKFFEIVRSKLGNKVHPADPYPATEAVS